MSAAEVAAVLGITDRQVRNYIHEGVVPAVQCASGWCIDPENLTKISVVRGRHRNPRPRKQQAGLAETSGSVHYWIDNPTAAYEVARIARQIFKAPSEVSIEELSPGECYWRVANPNVTDQKVWLEISQAAYNFFMEQGLRDGSGHYIRTQLKLRTPYGDIRGCNCGSPGPTHEPFCNES